MSAQAGTWSEALAATTALKKRILEATPSRVGETTLNFDLDAKMEPEDIDKHREVPE
jgi:hypothetical protein